MAALRSMLAPLATRSSSAFRGFIFSTLGLGGAFSVLAFLVKLALPAAASPPSTTTSTSSSALRLLPLPLMLARLGDQGG